MEERKLLSQEIQEKNSKKITELVCEFLEAADYEKIHIYTDPRDGEVNTKYIQEYCEGQKKDIYTSKTLWKSKTLQTIDIKTEEIYEGDLDIIVCPGIVFHPSGHRIGYGYGFYDRFLSEQKDAFKIGLAHAFQMEVSLWQTDIYDIPMDMIITSDEITTREPKHHQYIAGG